MFDNNINKKYNINIKYRRTEKLSKKSSGIDDVFGFVGGIAVLAVIGNAILGNTFDQTKDNVINGLNYIREEITQTTGIELPNILGETPQTQAKPTNNGATFTLSDKTTVTLPEWSLSAYPNYYAVVGASSIDKASFPEAGKIVYSSYDSLGRTQIAKGSLTYDNVKGSYGVRQKFTEADKPTGWGNNAIVEIAWINNKTYRGFMENKSHLIADSLGGDAKQYNIITGTRPQNVGGTDQKGGMRYPEMKAQKWIESHHDGVLYYASEPLYNGNELVPRAVVVSMLSSDSSINERVITFNTANGYTIDYTTGKFTKNQ